MQDGLRQFRAPAMVTVAVCAAPLLPEPLGYWAALAALLLGPGVGVAALLFPRGHLSLPEQLALTVLASIGLAVGALATLNAFAVPLTAQLIGWLVVGMTWLTALGAALARRPPPPPPSGAGPEWAAFALGAALALACVAGLWIMLA